MNVFNLTFGNYRTMHVGKTLHSIQYKCANLLSNQVHANDKNCKDTANIRMCIFIPLSVLMQNVIWMAKYILRCSPIEWLTEVSSQAK